MHRIREIVTWKNYFSEFMLAQPEKVQVKIYKILEAVCILERIPSHYLKSIKGVDGLYEARVQLGSNIWRVFCCFDDGKLVVLLNGFQKKSQKTPLKDRKSKSL